MVALGLRGDGVGARVVLEFERWAGAAGADRVLVTSPTRRDGAHRFDERAGYRLDGYRFVKALVGDRRPDGGEPATGGKRLPGVDAAG